MPRRRLEHAEFHGSHSSVKRLCRALERARGVRPEDVAIPGSSKDAVVTPRSVLVCGQWRRCSRTAADAHRSQAGRRPPALARSATRAQGRN